MTNITNNDEANARLIAAAPELLEALVLAYDRLTAWRDTSAWLVRNLPDSEAIPHKNMVDNLNFIIIKVEAAIGKTEGK